MSETRVITVTGAAGFVGRHLVDALLAGRPDCRVRALDIRAGTVRPDRLTHFTGSIDDPQLMAEAVVGAHAVVHLAARVEPHSSAVDEMERINVRGALVAYTAAVQAGCRTFIHLSSAGVYGHPRQPEPFVETDALEPRTPYQVTKWRAEEELRRLDSADTRLVMLRPAGIYGPGSTAEVAEFRKVMRQKVSVELSGGIVVHPTNVRDVVRAIEALVDHPVPHGSVFNIGGERALLLQELQALIARALNISRLRIVVPRALARPLAGAASLAFSAAGRPKPLLRPMSAGERFSAAVDDRLLRSLFPHLPVVHLEDGLREHLEWASKEGLLASGGGAPP